MAAATARETSAACKGRLRLHLLRCGLLRDQAFPVTRRAGPTARSALGRFMPFVGSPTNDRIGWLNADGPVMDGSKDRKDVRFGFTDLPTPSHRAGAWDRRRNTCFQIPAFANCADRVWMVFQLSPYRAVKPELRSQHPEHAVGEGPVIAGRAAGIVRLAPHRRNRSRSRRRRGRIDRCGRRGRLLSARREKRHGNDDDSHRHTTEQPVTGHCFGSGDHPALLTLRCS
jgi:hypothetical protein